MFVKNEKIKVVQNCLKLREIWLHTIFGFFGHPPRPLPPQKNRVIKKNGKNLKNQCCFKLPEMVRQLKKTDFWILDPLPSKRKFEKVLVDKKYLSNFQFFNMGSCLSSSSRRCSPVSPPNFSLPLLCLHTLSSAKLAKVKEVVLGWR